MVGSTMMRIKVIAENCAGCRQCEMVCSFQNTKKFSPSLSRVTVHKDDRDGLDYPVLCHQCIQCPPIETCQTGAISKTTEGWTWIEWQTCIGCGACVSACSEVFEMGDDGKAKVKTKKNIPCVKEAIEACPVDAIK